MLSDLSQGSNDVILDQYNIQHQTHIKRTDVVMRKREDLSDTLSHIEIVPMVACDMNGSCLFQYNRCNITELLDGMVLEVDTLNTRKIYAREILPQLNERYGIKLGPTEIFNEKLILPGQNEIHINSNISNLYYGKFNVYVKHLTLKDRIAKTTLDGFSLNNIA